MLPRHVGRVRQEEVSLMKRMLLASLLLLGAAVGCDKKDKDVAKDGATSANPAAASAAAPAGSTQNAAAPPTAPAAAPTTAGAGAINHLPGNCEVVGRIDLAALVAAPAVKDQVVPALEEVKAKEPTGDS